MLPIFSFAIMLAGQPSSDPPESRLEPYLHVAVAASMIAHGVDLATSTYAFGRAPDRYREANPLLRWAEQDPAGLALAKMGTAVAANWVLLHYHERHPKLTLVAALAQAGLVSYVAIRNARNIPQE